MSKTIIFKLLFPFYQMNEEILEGLKSSVARGESLYQAMMSFYNAGYSKEEIESSARALQGSFISRKFPAGDEPQSAAKMPLSKPAQIVSSYGGEKAPREKITMVILLILMLLLIGVLISVFIFRDKISGFLLEIF